MEFGIIIIIINLNLNLNILEEGFFCCRFVMWD